MSHLNLSKKLAVVTGATRGIGYAIASRLLEEGAHVIGTGTRPEGSIPTGCEFRCVDFSDLDHASIFAKELSEIEPDILINNAGINKIDSFEKINPEDFDFIQRINVRAPFLLCRSVLPGMKRKKWGRIVTISSIFGHISKEFRASYSASKFAVDGMTAALSAEVAGDGILANCVAPGFINTELTRSILGKEGIADLVSRIPAGRLGKAEEVAALVAWLVGPENTYISGQNIIIDGGFSRV
ncbi:3-oxoacyl-(acyl-carrier-protein) reductase FabG [Candidatus Desulfarcum epimagneticum]|uniref:3-oxoacyl-(Acyl-carrier-protein) reductase FabG n=1 Tax=uncultured Desulfobacteraceae bacterium TaxID=218296 RepID=A0A484HGY9_9BACT|nr:3-oxoacyl-(acyl-carrier-protein) reductase FabG [uncultured Desulfobacteraceae bacterium]